MGGRQKKITFDVIGKKHLRIVAYLVGSWAIAYGISFISDKPELVGLAPAINYIGYVIEKELRGEGYIEAIRTQNK